MLAQTIAVSLLATLTAAKDTSSGALNRFRGILDSSVYNSLNNSLGGTYVHTPNFTVIDTPGWPLPNPVVGTIVPWGGVHVHDPSIVKFNGSYYSFSTHDLVAISKAPSMYGPWTKVGSVLEKSSIIDNSGNTDPWAPDVHKVGDTFYCYYAVSTFGSLDSSIGLATSKTLEPGSWTDHGAVLTSSSSAKHPLSESNAIDPNLLVVEDKKGNVQEAYLQWGSFWSDIWQIQLNNDLSVPDDALEKAVNLAFDGTIATHPEEGAYLHKASNGYYYLFVSNGVCCGYNTGLPDAGQEYKILVGRSKSPSGPFLDQNGVSMAEGGGYRVFGSHGNIYGPGGQGVFTDDDGQDIIYYHYVDLRVSLLDEDKRLGWNYLNYDKNGWPYLA
ncbi:hypothetical protein TRVA0_020S02520 [Trichomonascus vanleenenianus]|uniref:arabinan endo-1,5-alpha-L-arabinosidase n=1 Tax=Trichomonascus vanleenenianus TaxID=2268995 RepID=UPI003ECB8AA4